MSDVSDYSFRNQWAHRWLPNDFRILIDGDVDKGEKANLSPDAEISESTFWPSIQLL
jgi:hypothetical protein